MNFSFIESLPIVGIFVVLTLLILGFCEMGFSVGHYFRRSRNDADAPTSVGPMVGGLLGMLGFVLAFTFSLAANQFGVRKQNVLLEANSIGTAYLRTDLLDDQTGAKMRLLLREYVDIRLNAASGNGLSSVLARSVEIHALLWEQVSSAAVANPNPNSALVVQSVNDVIDLHETRVTGALHHRIPISIWIALTAITALTMMTMGMQIGLSGKRRLVAEAALSLAFAVLIALVVGLDRPTGGLIKVSQQAMIDLQNGMRSESK